ncbi:hypothetical protein DID76_03400 [Candidatus Marinamargulisbacteria bacterium SCGC AG-414-C22]|nr:hypothetical protein DID76_03400 [Candidatus Marinamargulisbacteria bacterium SCGC AG-414-C22]
MQSLYGADWHFASAIGNAFHLPSTLTITQDNQPDIELDAKYTTKAFKDYPYWSTRVERWTNDNAWEFELLHHKVYLDNPTADMSYFNMSDGYNFVFINRAKKKQNMIQRIGLGVIVIHPESKIRGQVNTETTLADGYEIGGPGVQVSIAKRKQIKDLLYLHYEGKVTVGYTTASVYEGKAKGFNIACHINIGFSHVYPGKNGKFFDKVRFFSPISVPFVLDELFPKKISKV